LHTADSYLRIAGFLQASSQTPGAHAEASQGRNPIQRPLVARATRPLATPKLVTTRARLTVTTRRRPSILMTWSAGCRLDETPSASSLTWLTTDSTPCHPPAVSDSVMGRGPWSRSWPVCSTIRGIRSTP
jgi:hypothetical protein